MSSHDGYGTHLPHLVATFLRTSGDVLEVGTGFYSTPVLSDLCGKMGRNIWSYETDPKWGERLRPLGNRYHHTYEVLADYSEVPCEKSWGLAFLDCVPGTKRAELLERLRHHAKVIVVHDADNENIRDTVLSFPNLLWLDHISPWPTAIVSQEVEVDEAPIFRPSYSDDEQGLAPRTHEAEQDEIPPDDEELEEDLPEPVEIDPEGEKALRDARLDGPTVPFYTRNGESLNLHNWMYGKHAFLMLSGPSLLTYDLSQLRRRGIVTMGVNNSWSVWRPDLWVSVDHPGSFIDTGWKDPGIIKFAPLNQLMDNKFLRVKGKNGRLRRSKFRARDMPSCFFYRMSTGFDADRFMTQATFNWGNGEKDVDALGNKGSRSVMLVAIRLLYHLGFRDVYLLGADFKMEEGKANYAFDQERSRSSIRGNNGTYKALNSRFAALKDDFKRRGFRVWNCLENSGLKVFPHKPYQECVDRASAECEKPVDTRGWYEPDKKNKR